MLARALATIGSTESAVLIVEGTNEVCNRGRIRSGEAGTRVTKSGNKQGRVASHDHHLCLYKTNQVYVSESRLTMYSSVVLGAYFASFPGQEQPGRHEIVAPPLGLQKKAID